MQAADSVMVILMPESGDEVQMLKAGLMEIGNIFAINKSDRHGANKLMITLQNLLSTLTYDDNTWQPEVIHTIALEGQGIDALLKSIRSHKAFKKSTGIQRQKFDDRYKRRVNGHISSEYQQKFWDEAKTRLLQSELQKNQQDRLSPYLLSRKLLVS